VIPLGDATATCYHVVVEAEPEVLLSSAGQPNNNESSNELVSQQETIALMLGLTRTATSSSNSDDRLQASHSSTAGSSFNFMTKKTLPMAITLHHANGVLARWRVYFEEGTAFSSVAAVDCVARCTGEKEWGLEVGLKLDF